MQSQTWANWPEIALITTQDPLLTHNASSMQISSRIWPPIQKLQSGIFKGQCAKVEGHTATGLTRDPPFTSNASLAAKVEGHIVVMGMAHKVNHLLLPMHHPCKYQVICKHQVI
jgi:hypothetical protein